MSRIDNKHYQRQVALTMVVYMLVLLGCDPLLRATDSLPLKALLAMAPVLPMIYVIVLMGRKIRDSDELEQRTHLVALGFGTALVSTLSMVGGFLAAGGVLHLSGAVLIWVFPVLMVGYAVAQKWVARRYGVDAVCVEEGSAWLPGYFVGTGLLMGVLALYAWWHQGMRDAGLFGLAAGIFVVLGLWIRSRQVRARRRVHEG